MKKDKRITATESPYKELQAALCKFDNEAGWKDLIPTLFSWLNHNQPKDIPYDLKFWIKQYHLDK